MKQPSESKALTDLQESIGYRFADASLLVQALTHRSFCNEQQEMSHNSSYERLEFLGDAILKYLHSEMIYEAFPSEPEGSMSKMRASWENEHQLALMARRLDLGVHVRFGRGELKQGGRQKDSILADVFEALLAAIYLDGGVAAARRFVAVQFAGFLAGEKCADPAHDYKSRLKEQLQQQGHELPLYRLVAVEGPEHRRIFQVEVVAESCLLGAGRGASKKKAEQMASKEALAFLTRHPDILSGPARG
ncbi:MAG: ribonuclease III [Deltaproteobacteria bacterium]|nr:ribonuclease III [Candidatus Anaeroferrophillus wilburensis]MBN2889286.1 ribonuclease III [Deltaproteobacteria bacterium]